MANHQLEVFEWDNVWWEHTENDTAKRVLYIGDSISCGTRRFVTELSDAEILCDGFGTSKALDNPYLKPTLELCLRQQSKCDAILFNNGLHGFHLSDAEYERLYDDMLQFLTQTGKPVYVLLSTDVLNNPAQNQTVDARNQIAAALAQKYRLPCIDLHAVATHHPECHVPDGIHFTDQGYKLLANCILEHLR
ncbi:MAG: SGNH/GDSL hydrolase family protein [Ruminococcaceae bacterium]|nr:SGNH/GDSL hydrolase family protein [Oscillospiraceae bacterium]